MAKNFKTEREGQIQFFKDFRINYLNNPVLVDNTDGIWNGNILEFKLNISDLNKVLFQTIKYLSKMRIKGESIPSNILLIDLNKEIMYVYKSKDYFDEIHRVYVGAASVKNEGFLANAPDAVIDYSTIQGAVDALRILSEDEFLPVKLDENCIVGWAERYYRENPKATKGDFLGESDENGVVKVIGEIREPKYFKGLIQPYTAETNEKFKYLMDKLNDKLKRKDLGAFFTPMAYAEKACELVREAISRVPEENDYIILDRASGTGNLEQAILNVLGEEVASHIVCSTYEYYEYKVLLERLGDKVRTIIPPTESLVEYSNGCIMNADAMSEEYINNPVIKSYVDNPNCTIILFENPPYRDMTVDHSNSAKRKSENYIASQAKKHLRGTASNDLANLFIWSGMEYYLRQPTDSYVIFSPVKYYKSDQIMNMKFISGYIFNRAHFHATESAISCILWGNEKSKEEKVLLDVFDIQDKKIKDLNLKFEIKKCNVLPSNNYDKAVRKDDSEDGICCNFDGTEHMNQKNVRVKKLYNPEIIGYVKAKSFNFDAMNRLIVRCGEYDAHGCFIRKDNYNRILPLWVAKMYPLDNWWEKGSICTTSDGGDAYTKDADFLKACLIYTCLSNQNKCLSFLGSDGREYQNELCFDDSKSKKPIALADLTKFTLNEDEKELMELWKKILEEAKKTKNYDSKWNYGVYQISKELNTFEKVGTGSKKQNVYDYPELNGNLNTLRSKLKAYYKKYISEKMFEYELVK